MADSDWMSLNDVTRWMADQNRDVQRLCKHADRMSGSLEPLQAQVEAFEKETKELKRKFKQSQTELKRERETQATVRDQFEVSAPFTVDASPLSCQSLLVLLRFQNFLHSYSHESLPMLDLLLVCEGRPVLPFILWSLSSLIGQDFFNFDSGSFSKPGVCLVNLL